MTEKKKPLQMPETHQEKEQCMLPFTSRKRHLSPETGLI